MNDNIPSFQERVIRRDIREENVIGATVSLLTASDPDSPHFGIRRYELVQNDVPEPFKLLVTNTTDVHYVQLVAEVSNILSTQHKIFCTFTIKQFTENLKISI